jgi:predicted nucleic acid-binding protein
MFAPPTLVLDSNVVLDWLVFRERSVAPLVAAITSGRVRWLATQAMRDELEHALTRGDLARWQPDRARIRDAWDRWAELTPESAAACPHALRCTDPDDQKFIDLALQVRAQALLSRDRAVLKLAFRARAFGLHILPPQDWSLAP